MTTAASEVGGRAGRSANRTSVGFDETIQVIGGVQILNDIGVLVKEERECKG